jgi:hypothetical protein
MDKMLEYKIDLEEMDKAEVLATLYNAATPFGMGFLEYEAKPMTKDDARNILDKFHEPFDYLKGRAMKIDLSDDMLDPSRYDNYYGAGTALKALMALSKTNQTNPKQVQDMHTDKIIEQAKETLRGTYKITKISDKVIELGLADVSDKLKPKLLQIIRKYDKRNT